MTQDEIIEMAKQAGYKHPDAVGMCEDFAYFDLEAFAKLVRNDYSNKHAQLWLKRIDEAVKAEREACAKVCEEYETANDTTATWLNIVAEAIRARGEA